MNNRETTYGASDDALSTNAEAFQEGYISPVVVPVSDTAPPPLFGETTGTASPNPGGRGPEWGSIVSGALIGVLVGAAVALLLAPRPGTQTRQEIAGALDDLKGRSESALDALQGNANDLALRANELAARTRETIAQTRDNFHRSIEAGRDAYQQRKEELNQELEG